MARNSCNSHSESEASVSAGKIISYIVSAILIFFGVLFIWGAFSPDGSMGWIPVGIISVSIGLVLIWFAGRSKSASASDNKNVTYKVDLSGDVNLETFKCKSCGGALSTENVKMVAGAPVVSCPYCNSTYQLTEEPKW
jgi:hypothetical protein